MPKDNEFENALFPRLVLPALSSQLHIAKNPSIRQPA
jgi:hypothetical protein